MLCLIDEPLGCAKTSGPYFLLALIAGLLPLVIIISYAVKDKIAISKSTVANYVPTLMFKTLKKWKY